MQAPNIVLGSPWLNFEGIISYLMVREKLGEDFWTLPSKDPVDVSECLKDAPIKRSGDLWHASVAQFPPEAVLGLTKFYKRFDERNCHIVETKVKKIQIDRGHFRAYMMNITHVTTRTVSFYVNGCLDEVLRLVSFLPGLGKKVVDGCGQFKSVSVDELSEDFSLVKDGVAMRPLPVSLGFRGEVLMRTAWRAPYWDKQNIDVCVVPGSKVFK
jgi:hypothetical protein